MSRFDITAVGEGGLRLSVPSGSRLERADTLDVHVAGTEANVLCGLSSLGWRTSWVSALPDSPTARRVESQLRSFGVDLSGVCHSKGGRLGTYYVEYGTSPRSTKVYFDRGDTAFTRMTKKDVDWDLLLDTRLIHLTGITAALSSTVMEILIETMDRAQAAGVPVSFDVNYRANLWSPQEAFTAMRPFIERAEILFVRREDAQTLCGFGPDAQEALESILKITNARHVAMSCSEQGLIASMNGQRVSVPARPVQIVDRLGAGDGLAAGFLHAWLDGQVEVAAEHGAAMAALALAQVGEQVATTRDELTAAMEDSTSQLQR